MKKLADNKENIDKLFEIIALAKDKYEVEAFMTDLCTPAELVSMAERWRVVGPVLKNTPYRQVHEETGVSVTTVGRVARYIAQGAGGYQMMYDRIEDQK